MDHSVKSRVSLNLPASLKTAAERFSKQDGVSLNQFIAVALAEKIGALGAAEFFAQTGQNGSPQSAITLLDQAPDIEPSQSDRR